MTTSCPGCHGAGTEPSGTTHAGLAEHLACGECGPGCPPDCGCRVDAGPERAESGRGTAATLEAENARLRDGIERLASMLDTPAHRRPPKAPRFLNEAADDLRALLADTDGAKDEGGDRG